MFTVSHHAIYVIFALAYAGSCVGIDHAWTAGVLAIGYAILAITD